jgi:Bacterial regulatory proteins, luxR family
VRTRQFIIPLPPTVETKGPHEIADDAGLSLPTVKKHVHLIFRKLEVASRSQLIALMRSGIVRDLLGLRSALKSTISNPKSKI